MEIIMAILGVICIPVYVVCVAILMLLIPIFGSYVDASVYVCEYGEPIVTGLLTLCFAIFNIKYALRAIKHKMFGRFTALIMILIIYISVLFRSVYTLIERLETYNGMTNRQIFDYVVEKLREMGSCFDGTVAIAGHEVGLRYIVFNITTYILPITIVLLCGVIQRIITKELKTNR